MALPLQPQEDNGAAVQQRLHMLNAKQPTLPFMVAMAGGAVSTNLK